MVLEGGRGNKRPIFVECLRVLFLKIMYTFKQNFEREILRNSAKKNEFLHKYALELQASSKGFVHFYIIEYMYGY